MSASALPGRCCTTGTFISTKLLASPGFGVIYQAVTWRSPRLPGLKLDQHASFHRNPCCFFSSADQTTALWLLLFDTGTHMGPVSEQHFTQTRKEKCNPRLMRLSIFFFLTHTVTPEQMLTLCKGNFSCHWLCSLVKMCVSTCIL